MKWEPEVTAWGPRHDAEVGLGPGSLHAEGHAGTDTARPVLKRPANT